MKKKELIDYLNSLRFARDDDGGIVSTVPAPADRFDAIYDSKRALRVNMEFIFTGKQTPGGKGVSAGAMMGEHFTLKFPSGALPEMAKARLEFPGAEELRRQGRQAAR